MADPATVQQSSFSLGPLNVFLCWESLALAAGVHVCTRVVKSALYLYVTDSRKKLWVKHVLMPLVPLLLGAVAAVVFPLEPDWLEDYVEAEKMGRFDADMLYFCYGGLIGIFADYIYHRTAGALELKKGLGAAEDDDDKTPPDRPAVVP